MKTGEVYSGPGNQSAQSGAKVARIYADGKALAHISTLIEAGSLQPAAYRTFPLEAAGEAMDLSQAGHVRGKLVLLVD